MSDRPRARYWVKTGGNCVVGKCVGLFVVGTCVGAAEGLADGRALGLALGAPEGLTVGLPLGAPVLPSWGGRDRQSNRATNE